MTASISLIYDGGYYIIVDSPSATDVRSKEIMLRGISSRNIVPGEIQIVVTTHGHPDHFGQGNFFPNARHFFGSYEYSDDNYITTELHTNNSMHLSKNVELWSTPGHTAQDISVVVNNVPGCGTVAVVGDLFYNKQDALNVSSEWFIDAWNPTSGKQNRDKIICHADYIIPGHGKMFKVSDEMKKMSTCGRSSQDINDISIYLPRSLHDSSSSISTTETILPFVPVFPFAPSMMDQPASLPLADQKSTTLPPFPTTDMIMRAIKHLDTSSSQYLAGDLLQKVNDALPHVVNTIFRNNTKDLETERDKSESMSSGNTFAPLVETAVSQLANLFEVNTNKTVRPEQEQLPFTRFWKSTIQKLARDSGLNRMLTNPSNMEIKQFKSLASYLRDISSSKTQQS